MIIAMFGHKWIPSREGGIEIVVEELATRMAALGHDVTCYNRKGQHVSGKEFGTFQDDTYKGVKIRQVATIDKRGLAAMTASISAAFRTAFSKAEVVHIHAEGPSFMCWIPKLFGKKVICTVHGLDHQRAKWGKVASFYIMQGEKNAVRFADDIIVLSRGVEEYFRKTYGRETVFIPNGVTKPEIIPGEKLPAAYGLEKDGYFLYLGRLVPEKGIDRLIKAFKSVRTDKKLVIAGGSSDTEEYAARLRETAAGDERVVFTGFVQGDTLGALYSNAYVYVLPSDLEGMPLSLLEAMSYGNCCLVSSIEECTSVIENNGVVFEKGNQDDLTAKLQTLADHPEIVRKYKGIAREYICSRFSWDRVTEETLRLYGRDRHKK